MISYLLNAITETLAPPKESKKIKEEPPKEKPQKEKSAPRIQESTSTYKVDSSPQPKQLSAYRQTLPVSSAKKSVFTRPSHQINYPNPPILTPGNILNKHMKNG